MTGNLSLLMGKITNGQSFSLGGSGSEDSACSAGGLGSIPGLGRFPGEGNGFSTSVFLPGEFHGQRSLAGYSLCGCRVRRD